MACDLSRFFVNSGIAERFNALLNNSGFIVTRSVNTLRAKRIEALNHLRPAIVLDVGANIGQYAEELRGAGYTGHIVSFEPDPASYSELQSSATKDPNRACLQVAVGERDGEARFQVRKYSPASSLRFSSQIGGPHAELLKVDHEIGVPLRRLDTVLPDISKSGDRFFLKIDTQGYEREVLMGAVETLKRTDAVEVELTLKSLYDGQALLPEIWTALTDAGFRSAWIERGYRDPEGFWLLQMDGLFVKESAWQESK